MIRKVLLTLGLAAALVSCSDDEADVENPVGTTGDQASQGTGGDATGGMGGMGGMGGTQMPSASGIKDAGTQAGTQVGTQNAAGGAIGGAKAAGGATGGVAGNAAKASAPEGEGGGDSRYVSASYLFVRSGPGMQHKPVTSLKFNTQVQTKEVSKGGHWVKIGDGKWVSAKYLSKAPNTKVGSAKK